MYIIKNAGNTSLQKNGWRQYSLRMGKDGRNLENNYLYTEINQLKAENKELREILQELLKQMQRNIDLYEEVTNELTTCKRVEANLYNAVRNMPYEILDVRAKDRYKMPKIMTWEETIDEIILNGKSICRFGDGEFGIISGVSRWRFQKNDKNLAKRLKEVLTSDDENILIGLNDFYGDLSHRTEADAIGIRGYITPEVRFQHMELLRMDKVYANAVISRNGTWERVRNQKRIWDNKDCVFIEGRQTRMGVGNDLFDNVKSIQRILCPSESAFDNYETILEEALKLPNNKTILIALGPTASVLAYDLAKAGYHAIDIGHVDLSYEWFRRTGSSQKAEVNYKYNNEYENGYIVEEIHDEVYESQIIADLSNFA